MEKASQKVAKRVNANNLEIVQNYDIIYNCLYCDILI